MPIRIVRLGDQRAADEGPRIGTVRFLPRGVPKSEYATRDYFDTWLPVLAPSAEAVRLAKSAGSDREWKRFVQRYRKEMASPVPRSLLDLLSALSRESSFSVGCYCADAAHCHRTVLADLLTERGAEVIPETTPSEPAKSRLSSPRKGR